MMKKSFVMVRFNKCFFLDQSFACKLSPLMEIWGWLTHFPITNFLCIYDCMLKKTVNRCIFNISTFWMVLCFCLLHLMEIFPEKTDNFWSKTIAKPFLTVVKYFETMINTKFSTVNYYLTNCNTKNWLWKEGNIM